MLRNLQIKHFAIAEHIELDIEPGLNVITGETGAGKSIIIRALGLVLGQRADSGIVKHGHKRAEIQADFDISQHPAVQALLIELELDEDRECLLRRVINADSGSKAYVNGRRVTAGILRQISAQMLDIHGQHEHQSLLNSETQQTLLDKYAGISDQVTQLQGIYADLRHAIEALQTLHSEADAAHEKRAFLEYQVGELEQFAPRLDEWDSLYARHQRIHHQAELAASVQAAQNLLYANTGDTAASASTQLDQAVIELEKALTIDPSLKEITEILNEAQTLINESELNLRQASESLTLDESELLQIEQRYSGYLDYARKHRIEPEQLYNCYLDLSTQLQACDHPEKSEQALLEKITSLADQYRHLADQISDARKLSAGTLSAAISQSMQKLAMEGGKFSIGLNPQAALPQPPGLEARLALIGRDTGNEKVSFEVSTNAGMPAQPLSKIVSGGELSRISLAMQLILSDLASVETLVFDEVDVGVGGKTAAVIGKMLARLARSRQILCITHLPQVAAYGNHHYHVNKQQGKQVVLNIDALNEEGKVIEIARMVGGETITEESLAHSRNLIRSST